VTAQNLDGELASLAAAYRRGQPREPRFCYQPAPPRPDLCRALQQLADRLSGRGSLGRLYAARARELIIEAELSSAVAQPRFRALARARYRPDGFTAEADRLADRWLRQPPAPPDDGPLIPSDDESDPRSLLRRTRTEVGRRRLPLRVIASRHLHALAATGPEVIYIARGRLLSAAEIERTVVHEICGHALPRARARRAPLGLFACGSARGSDEQEGRAICLEERSRLLGRQRRCELALRHIAGRAVQQGAGFGQVVRRLAASADVPLEDRLRIAARSHRGGGLAREVVYLPAYLRVRAAQREDPSIDDVLSHGRIAVDAAPTLYRWLS